MEFTEVTEENVLLYAAKNYNNPLGASSEDFYEDLKRIKYIKRLVNRYIGYSELSERLILNHIIVLNNVFGPDAASTLLLFKIEPEHWPQLKSFLVYLGMLPENELLNIIDDKKISKVLEEL